MPDENVKCFSFKYAKLFLTEVGLSLQKNNTEPRGNIFLLEIVHDEPKKCIFRLSLNLHCTFVTKCTNQAIPKSINK